MFKEFFLERNITFITYVGNEKTKKKKKRKTLIVEKKKNFLSSSLKQGIKK